MLLPRVLVVTAVWIVASGTLTFAADKTLTANVKPTTPAAAPKPTLVVPDVRGQAYVFAKGILADGGFAWRVVGSVRGYATNVVVSQTPAAGVRIVDTGAPTIELHLEHGRYAENGSPEDAAPYLGTAARPVRDVNAPAKKPARTPKRTRTKPAAKPAQKRDTGRRPAAFLAPGAPKEPLDEISLPARARQLDAWLVSARRPTGANQRHWLYQHAWIVTGAKFGWWHGADALRILIRVDERVQARWGIGARSEATARAALAFVQARVR